MKITKKQIKELHQSGDVSKLKEWYPSVFGEELEVGSWYYVDRKKEDEFKALVMFKGYGIETYGFSHYNIWTNIYGSHNTFKNERYIYTKATHQEIETALINEAKKRGFKKGVIVERPDSFINDGTVTILGGNFSLLNNNGLQLGGYAIMEHSTWAQIIKPKQMTQEQIEKELGYKIEIV